MRIDSNDPRLQEIASHYGMMIQMTKLAEECSEFAKEVTTALYCHLCAKTLDDRSVAREGIYGKAAAAHDNQYRELADLLVVTKEIEHLISRDEVLQERITKYMNEKINRQLGRIQEKET